MQHSSAHHIGPMTFLARLRAINANGAFRIAQLILGIILIIITPLVGILPGPGGVFVFAIGLGFILRNSLWAKRRYVEFKRVQPKAGSWADWGLRRRSAKRRDEKAKRLKERDG